jgi:hypothetical protein
MHTTLHSVFEIDIALLSCASAFCLAACFIWESHLALLPLLDLVLEDRGEYKTRRL